LPEKSIKVSNKYVDKKDIRNPCIGTDVSINGDKWDLIFFDLIYWSYKNIENLEEQVFVLVIGIFTK